MVIIDLNFNYSGDAVDVRFSNRETQQMDRMGIAPQHVSGICTDSAANISKAICLESNLSAAQSIVFGASPLC